MRRADRLLQVVHLLRARRRATTAQEIADRFGISVRTVYRDIQGLQYVGTPISGEAGVGYIIDRTYYLPPITFDVGELEALGLGVSMVQQWGGDNFSGQAASALDKIRAVLPTDLQGELEQVSTYAVVSRKHKPWIVDLDELRDCIRSRRTVDLRYVEQDKGTTERTVWPLALMFVGPE